MTVDHSVQRKKALALARPCDSTGEYIATFEPDFSLSKTIFQTLPSGIKTLFQRTKLDTRLTWADDAIRAIEKQYMSAGPAPSMSDDSPLHAFMSTECDFSTEHADGSFLDHLYFCREYTARHYPGVSPRIMLLHSIMGVGTNCFPMAVEKTPALAKLLTPEEFTHVATFPSVLRLLIHGPLLRELCACETPRLVSALRGIKLYRVIDNEPATLDADDLWTALNLQLIHCIDFLPAGGWQRTCNEYMFSIFIALHSVLERCGQLRARVDWDPTWMQKALPGTRPDTWRHWIVDMVPCAAISKMASRQIANYSAALGHSLEYELLFDKPDTTHSKL